MRRLRFGWARARTAERTRSRRLEWLYATPVSQRTARDGALSIKTQSLETAGVRTLSVRPASPARPGTLRRRLMRHSAKAKAALETLRLLGCVRRRPKTTAAENVLWLTNVDAEVGVGEAAMLR